MQMRKNSANTSSQSAIVDS